MFPVWIVSLQTMIAIFLQKKELLNWVARNCRKFDFFFLDKCGISLQKRLKSMWSIKNEKELMYNKEAQLQ